jgi:hypothetical protein
VLQPIFIDGRAVEYAGDSLIAMTESGFSGIIVRNRSTGGLDTLGEGVLHSPVHVQSTPDGWLVSDVEGESWRIVALDRGGNPTDTIDAGALDATPHQFARLPDGAVVVETPGGVLTRLLGTVRDTFALTDENPGSTGLLIAAKGGVLHAVPDRHITLYNGLGHARWRVEWPWQNTATVTDLAIDANGRFHVIAGIERNGYFVVYTLASLTGEVIRWSQPGPDATFIVERLGRIKPDDPANWTGG